MMASRCLLYLDTRGLSSFLVAQGTVIPDASFSRPGDGSFAAYLASRPDTVFSLVVDVPDEAFAIESQPFLRGNDRRHLLTRLQARRFPGTPFVTHRSLGRNPEGRRDERILFHALTRPALLQPWLDEISRANARFAGLHSAAAANERLGNAADANLPAFLLGGFTPSGIRLSLIENGRLRFSRLTPAPSAPAATLAPRLQEEARAIREHLIGQRELSRDVVLPVFVLAHPDDHADLSKASNADGAPLTVLDLQQVARKCGLRTPPTGSDSLPLILHVVATTRNLPQFAPESTLTARQAGPAGLAIGLAGACCAALCIAASLQIHTENGALAEKTVHDQARLKELEVRLARVEAETAALPAPQASLQPILQRMDDLKRASLGPDKLLAALARTLDAFPDVALHSLEWTVSPSGIPEAIIELDLPEGLDEQPRQLARLCRQILDSLQSTPSLRASAEQLPAGLDARQTTLLPAKTSAKKEMPRLIVRMHLEQVSP